MHDGTEPLAVQSSRGGALATPPTQRRSSIDPALSPDRGGPPGPRGPGGSGDRGDGGGGDGGRDPREGDDGEADGAHPDEVLRLGVGLWMAAIVASFLVFILASASIALGRGAATTELPAGLGARLLLSTLALAASSVAIEAARRRVAADARGARRLCRLAFALGVAFLFCQLVVWRHLVRAEVFAEGDGRATAFWVLTGLHGLHVLGGLGYQALVLRRLARAVPRAGLGLCAWYWHFLGALWLVVLGALAAFA